MVVSPIQKRAESPESFESASPALRNRPGSLARREQLSYTEFFEEFVDQGLPVIVPGALRRCPALSRWNLDYLRVRAGNPTVRLKAWYGSELRASRIALNEYLDSIEDFESSVRAGAGFALERPAYLHDMPLVSILPEAISDLTAFPATYFPAWYRSDWWRFAQIFLGPSQSLTPLHFDTLLTHNLFFQVMGRKRFILLAHDQRHYCYRYGWRWFEVDPEQPDYDRHPLYRNAKAIECIVEPGDMLYLPPGMLHHVRSLECAISFNVDWHTKATALKGLLGCLRGMPLKNIYYNAVIALGMCTALPAKRVLPFFRSYLNYVS